MSDANFEKKLTGFVIHGFAVAHATAAALLSQTLVGDEAALTTLTITMILSIARINGRKWGVGEALSVIGVLAGGYIGTRGVVFLIKWIPGIGNIANAVTTFGVTELLGWIAYILVKDDKKPSELSDEERKVIKNQAEKLKEEEHENSKQLYERMSSDDKEEYDQIMKQLGNKDVPEDTRNYLIHRLETIARKYVD